MRTRLLGLCSIILVLLSLLACGGNDSEPSSSGDTEPTAAGEAVPAASLQVVDQREIEVSQASIISLSPDGQWMAIEKLGKHLCILQVASGAEQSCTLSEDLKQLNPSSVTWSPDSRYVTLTEYATKYMVESDVWVMEVESGKLSNLTDDGVTGNLLRAQSGGDEAWVDIAPAWSPDGKQLIFARTTFKGDEKPGTELFRVSAKGENAKKLLTVTPEDPMTVWYGLSWSGAAESIVYSVNHNKLENPVNGIWIADAPGDGAQRLMSPDPDLGPVILWDVSASGEAALVHYYTMIDPLAAASGASSFSVLDLKTGAKEPLEPAIADEAGFAQIVNATFSPDGTKVLYAYLGSDEKRYLAVRDLDGEVENILLTVDGALGYGWELGLGLDWAADDTIFVCTSNDAGLLISLSSD